MSSFQVGPKATPPGRATSPRATPTPLPLRAAPPSATVAPTGSLADYSVLSTLTGAGTQATFSLQQPVTTRFLLVWLTSVPKVTDGYQGKVAEIQVLG